MLYSHLEEAPRLNAVPGDLAELDGFDCPICGSKGFVYRVDEAGLLYAKECPCMAKRRSLRSLRRSGLGNIISQYTFSSFSTPDAFTAHAKRTALDYVKSGGGKWFYISGRPGTGKTHLCTAVCRRFLGENIPVRYMLWREQAPELKAMINAAPENYFARMKELALVPVLYIDDFLKGSVTAADLNLAFTLINARYNRQKSRTLISSERKIEEICKLDEAIGSRIWQRAEGYRLAAPAGAKNWRRGQEKNALETI